MKTQAISKNWFIIEEGKMVESKTVIPANVPGTVCSDLIANGRLPDPYYRDNEKYALEKMGNNYRYTTKFDINQEVYQCHDIIIRFDGLDTIADIFLNGELLGKANNMHRTWEYKITNRVREKGNELSVLFYSPTAFIKKEYEKDPVEGTSDAMKGFPKIRKAHYMFGWDWGPRIPDIGIIKPVSLIGIEHARLYNVLIRQEHQDYENGTKAGESPVVLTIQAEIEKLAEEKSEDLLLGMVDGYSYQVSVFDEKNQVIADRIQNAERIQIDNPNLWWPNGYGKQPLYTIRIELLYQDNIIQTVTKRIGLRSMTIDQSKDQYGERFAHKINGVSIFAMGADYIPEDNLLSRMNKERTKQLLLQCKAAHFNCVRVWGGGFYPGDDFYDSCDELGLLVWQDFMFACGVYRLSEDFEENIKMEIIDNIRRIRHHACLGLWCGNNEMELFTDKGEWGATYTLKSDYVKMYEYIFPKIVKKEDPDTFYWPASPSSGGGFDNPNDENRGDVHYWEVWHGNEPFTEYRKFFFRYLSEFGFQSFPSMKTIETFTMPEDRNVFSYIMEKHQRNADANGKIMNYMEQMYLYPNSMELLVYASQLLQAEAIRYGVEHFRRNRGRCMGTVYWQLNDCWPVASWSSIDYFGRWKALHYYAKRFFAPLMISCEEEGLLSQGRNVNQEPKPVEKSIRLSVANETMKVKQVQVCWQLREADGTVKREEKIDITIPALESYWLDKENLEEALIYEDYVSYQLLYENNIVSEGTVLFCPPKHFHFQDPELLLQVEKGEIIVSAKKFAKNIEIRNAEDNLLLEDNFFDLNGNSRKIKVLSGELIDLSVRSVYNIR